AHCRGDFIYFLDDDDVVYQQGICHLVAAAVKNPQTPVYGIVVHRECGGEKALHGIQDLSQALHGAQGLSQALHGAQDLSKVLHGAQGLSMEKSCDGHLHSNYLRREIGEPFDFNKLVFENYIPTNALMVPASVIEKVGEFDTAFEIFEDWDWIIRMASLYTPRFVDRVVAEYRCFQESTLGGKGGEAMHLKHRLMLLDKHMALISPSSIVGHVKRSVDGVVLEKEREISFLKDGIKREKLKALHHSQDSLKLGEEVSKLKEEAERQRQEADSWKREAMALEKELMPFKEELQRCHVKIEEADQELFKLRAHVEWQQTNLQNIKAELQCKLEHIAWQQDNIVRLENELALSNENSDKLFILIEQQQKELSQKGSMLDQITVERNGLLAELNKNQTMLNDCRSNLEEITISARNTSRELDLVHGSISWRVTAPLRVVM
ncbi:MAG: hypothetical protein HQK66_10740, partial [Desulfamplus sp.]|nr:hypothetical protein [Desulfamplus sp.]